ncbi:hypothetical protein BRADI_1g19411v3 [Brachypodium distachyon]|uniref:Uncharacterized protein n=1 Tax=Brachypodium distachyon TaxID=15368 RepID=I1GRP4_BRADI|nr:hypothetical protein BRADI_1g19411v3 [Brachypodium distachyon]
MEYFGTGTGAGGEHHVNVLTSPSAQGSSSTGGRRPAAAGGKAAGPAEKWLNRFVRAVALMERMGNALGTLAFTWATVVLLGGYAKDLSYKDDFWFATAIVFLEAARHFPGN